MNSELQKLCGTPNNATNGQMTRSDNEASRRSQRASLGMGTFSPRAGENTKGNYIVQGVSTPGGGAGPKRSHLRGAGETR